MGEPNIDRSGALGSIRPPSELQRQTAEQQSRAPNFGLGFRKDRLEREFYRHLVEAFRACAPRFRSEGAIDCIQTLDERFIPALYFEDRGLNARVLRELKPAHEAWCGMALEESACYGFRVYQRGSYLHNHVDRTATHIVSSTICIDYRIDEPWPLYIEDAEGNAFKVDMEPGEFLFYEGARLIHGRPWPLNGDYYAGMFVHYRPVGFALGRREERGQ